MTIRLPIDTRAIKGFLAAQEGEALYHLAAEASGLGPCLEVGSYCGKSTIYLAAACKLTNSVLFAVDHHRGSEEHQRGEEYHDPELFDDQIQMMDSFGNFRANIRAAALDDWVVPIVASSSVAARCWNTPLGLVFIDGSHSLEAAMADYRSWPRHIVPGGYLAIHDIFPDPAYGGQAPYDIYKLALASAQFELVETVDTLGILRRL
ncbi:MULTISPECIES: class I SAM-dependent methyltransferase [unclassified Microbulbifer]|uniref:Class I SAM-dependent methyltransferase n=1 Tax=Microbulbifer spongiae TaxID=2944933 RepID=A0ABY9EFP5_9GAMM|nr:MULTISPECIES: class I SAM-dependent methyltransferase [unclassified Microbulbifer]MDP5209750.1 class I SAM-dependent methyltransferase [Microbulbifer sp. 2205BS26-8]WKD51492.1 class I SAM-dependent methyltransferase [Microbulbifer sp. MI-G]